MPFRLYRGVTNFGKGIRILSYVSEYSFTLLLLNTR
jgi:hypothetical protein